MESATCEVNRQDVEVVISRRLNAAKWQRDGVRWDAGCLPKAHALWPTKSGVLPPPIIVSAEADTSPPFIITNTIFLISHLFISYTSYFSSVFFPTLIHCCVAKSSDGSKQLQTLYKRQAGVTALKGNNLCQVSYVMYHMQGWGFSHTRRRSIYLIIHCFFQQSDF